MRLGISMSERDKDRLEAAALLPGERIEYATGTSRSRLVVVTQWRLLLIDGAGAVVHDLDGADARHFRWSGTALYVWTSSGEASFGHLAHPADAADLHAALVWVGQQPAPHAERAAAADLLEREAAAVRAARDAEASARVAAQEAKQRAREEAKRSERLAREEVKQAEQVARDEAKRLELARAPVPATGRAGAVFPAKSVELQAEVIHYLERARRTAHSDIRAEEVAIWNAYNVAERAGVGRVRAVRKWIDAEVAAGEAAGELRVDSQLIGVVVDRMGLRKLHVYNDRVRLGKNVHVVDRHVEAVVEIDGAIFERSRPTLTRMAILAPLPGSALGAGLATQKTTRSDQRTASFTISHPEWVETIRLDPTKAPSTRPIAHRLNAIAGALADAASASPAATETPRQPTAMGELHAELERLAEMVAAGVISTDEAAVLRARLLG